MLPDIRLNCEIDPPCSHDDREDWTEETRAHFGHRRYGWTYNLCLSLHHQWLSNTGQFCHELGRKLPSPWTNRLARNYQFLHSRYTAGCLRSWFHSHDAPPRQGKSLLAGSASPMFRFAFQSNTSVRISPFPSTMRSSMFAS